MDNFKILLLLFSAGLHLHVSNASKPSKPWQHNTRRTSISPDNHKNCICFKDGELPIVQQFLDPDDNGLERVVIYLYINDVTKEIKMYTPSADKQMLIPDLFYEPNDALVSVTPDNLYPSIYSSPNKIKVYKNRFENLDPEVSHSLPIGLNVGAIEHVLPPVTDDVYLNPQNNSNGNEYALDSSVIPNAQITALVSESQHDSSTYPENVDTNVYFPTEGNTYKPEPTQPYWMSDNTNSPNGQGQDFPDNTQSSPVYAQAFPSPQAAAPESIQAFPTNSQSTPDNIQIATGVLQAFPSTSQGVPDSQPLTGYAQAFPTNSATIPDSIQPLTGYAFPTNSQGRPENIRSLTGYPQAYPTISQNNPDNVPSSTVYAQAFPTNFQGIPENIQPLTGNLQAFPSISQSFPENIQPLTGYAQAIPSNSQGIPENIQSLTGYAQAFPSNSQGIPENIQSLPGHLRAFPTNSQGIPGNSQSYIVHPQATPSNSQAFIDYVQTSQILHKPQDYWDNSQSLLEQLEAKPLSGELDQHVVYTFQKSQNQGPPPISKEIQGPHYSQFVTFNIWFHQQMKRFQNINLPNQIQSVDNQFLRLLVLKTLSDNNIFINDDGIITDSNGALIDLSNLELRPLLIGEKINQRIFQNQHKPITLPKYMPYLESILVTFVSPPSILGIIPLGKTYLLQKSNRTPLVSGLIVNRTKIFVDSYGNGNPVSYLTSSEPYSLIVKTSYTVPMKTNTDSIDYLTYAGGKHQPIPFSSHSAPFSKSLATAYPSNADEGSQADAADIKNWSLGLYSSSTQPPYVTNYIQSLPSKRRKQTGEKIEHHVETMKTRKKNGGLLKKRTSLKGNVDTVEPELFANVNGSESARRFLPPSLTGVMKTLLQLLDNLPSKKDSKNSSERSDIGEESESDSDREGPNFRIIGGSAATGSGSPVSNKGRSGLTDSI